jgi:hypothetical protein
MIEMLLIYQWACNPMQAVARDAGGAEIRSACRGDGVDVRNARIRDA